MHLIIGLGNPGAAYARHRHNIGFQIVDLLAARHGMRFDKKQHSALLAMGMIEGQKVVLAKPQTFMNNSGRAVAQLLQFYKVALEQMIVVMDDLDLPFAQLRLRPQGGAGGQNGMRSIIQHVGTNEIARLRVGIGRPPGQMDPAAYVLQNYSAEQEKEMEIVRQLAVDALELWLAQGILLAMNRTNLATT